MKEVQTMLISWQLKQLPLEKRQLLPLGDAGGCAVCEAALEKTSGLCSAAAAALVASLINDEGERLLQLLAKDLEVRGEEGELADLCGY